MPNATRPSFNNPVKSLLAMWTSIALSNINGLIIEIATVNSIINITIVIGPL